MTSHVKCRSATADRKQSKSNGPSGLRRCILKKLKTALCRKSTIGAPGHAQHCGCGSPASKSGRDYGNTSFTYTRAAAAAVWPENGTTVVKSRPNSAGLRRRTHPRNCGCKTCAPQNNTDARRSLRERHITACAVLSMAGTSSR